MNSTEYEVIFTKDSITRDIECTFLRSEDNYHKVLVLKNLSDICVNISVEILVFNIFDDVLQMMADHVTALQKGASTAIKEFVSSDKHEEYWNILYMVTVKEEKLYESMIEHLSYSYEIGDNKKDILVHVTNNSEMEGNFVKCIGLFFNQGSLIGCDEVYIPDDGDDIIYPGQTITEKMESLQGCDQVVCYFRGEGDSKI